jgi:hypothetical protein
MKPVTRIALTATLTVLAAAAAAQTTPQRPAGQPQNQTNQGSDQSTGTGSESRRVDKQALINVCVSQVQVSNPSVPAKDIKDFCASQVNRLAGQD